MKDPRFWPLPALLGLHAALGAAYLYGHAPGSAPDEAAHRAYVRTVASEHRLPVAPLHPALVTLDESHQPPLYYVLAAPLYTASRGSWRALRWQNLLYSIANVAAIYWLARALCGPLGALAAAAFAALLPQALFINTSVSNDALAALLCTLLLALAARGEFGGFLPPVVAGLAMLSKMTALAPLLALALSDAPAFSARKLRPLFGATLASGWFYFRNWRLYGDPFRYWHYDFSHCAGPGMLRWWLAEYFQSFWARFGWMNAVLPQPVYGLLALATGAGLIGFYVWEKRVQAWRDPAWRLVAGAAVLTFLQSFFAGYLLMGLPQPQGRFLFPALGPVAVILTRGWSCCFEASPKSLRAALIAVGIISVVGLHWLSWRAL